MIYPLRSLLSLRHHREENAKNEVRKEEKKYEHEQEHLIQLQKSKEEYERKLPELVESEYEKIIGKNCTLKDIENVKEKVAKLEQVLVMHSIKIEEQKQVIEKCKENLLKAREAVLFARKEAIKIEKHQEIWLSIQQKEAQRMEDLELEEFSSVKELD